MKKVKLKCTSEFKFGNVVFKEGGSYEAEYMNGFYTVSNNEERIVLEDLSIFFELKENKFREKTRSLRKYTSKEEIYNRMKWEDFSIGGVTLELEDFEKVGLSQYAFNLKDREDVQLRIKIKNNENVLVQDNQKYEDILEKMNVKEGSVAVTKMLDQWTGVPVNVDPDLLRAGKYKADFQGFLSK